MFYRVVIQGRTLGGADLDEVKHHLVRVTGLSLGVAEELLGGMPQVIKRRVQQTDAERIAATLRAIGAAATVEREDPGAEVEAVGGIRVAATPFNNGPPSIIPGAEAPVAVVPAVSRRKRLLRATRSKWVLPIGAAVAIAAAILLGLVVEYLVADTHGVPAPVVAARVHAPTPEVEPVSPVLNANLLQGPWRCTDQRTGVSAYWSYGAGGALTYHGDILSERPATGAPAESAPTAWKLDGQLLVHSFAQQPPVTYNVTQLTLARLQYGGERRLEVECRRP